MPDIDVLIIGGGPAGLAAGIEARRLGMARVVVVDREDALGGIPRHADHTGFGMRDLHRLLTGPRYAQRYIDLAERAGVHLRPATTVTDWLAPHRLRLTAASGVEAVTARAVILATGCRERPRAARLVAGDRPIGVFTTGALQQLVYLQHQRVGRRAVIVGAEHVSFSAVLTAIHGGATVATMLTEHPRHQTYPPYMWLSATRFRVPILTRHRVSRINGRRRVASIDIDDLRTGRRQSLACDTVVFTGDWIPDNELARRLHLDMDPASRAPRVDAALRTSARGVFAAGNLIHAAETADVAALGGRHAAQAAAAFLEHGDWPSPAVPIVCEPPINWISPSAITPSAAVPPRALFTWRVSAVCTRATVCIQQGARVLWSRHFRSLIPTRPLTAPADWLRSVDPGDGPVVFRLLTG